MPLHRTVESGNEAEHGHGSPRPQGAARAPRPEARRPPRAAEDREPIFDIADFAAIARFAGIAPDMRRTG